MCIKLFNNDLLTIHDIDALRQLSAHNLSVECLHLAAHHVVDGSVVFHHLDGTDQCGSVVLVENNGNLCGLAAIGKLEVSTIALDADPWG